MDSTRFDNLTRALATAPTRRKAIGAIIATIGGALGLGGLGTAFADCKPAGHQCSKAEHCCSNICCNRVCCANGQICSNGTCVTTTTTTTTTTTSAPTTTTTTSAPMTTTAAPSITKGTLLFHSFNA